MRRISSDVVNLALRQFMQRVTSMSGVFVNSLRDVIMKGKLRSVLGLDPKLAVVAF